MDTMDKINLNGNMIKDDIIDMSGSMNDIRVPDFLKLDPDEIVRYFKPNPRSYFDQMRLYRDQYRVSKEKLNEFKEDLRFQLKLPHQSRETKEIINAIMKRMLQK
jgi:hypothetical protein